MKRCYKCKHWRVHVDKEPCKSCYEHSNYELDVKYKEGGA